MIIDPSSQQEFSDADFRIVDNADQSKKLAFQVSGITTATTRTVTVPDSDVTVSSFIAGLLDDTTASAARSTLGITQGTYTPTLVNVANVASSSVGTTPYVRVGDMVIVLGQVSIDPTAATTFTQISMTLPVASNLGTSADLGGAGISFGNGWRIGGDSTNDLALFSTNVPNTADLAVSFIFAYRVI